MKCPDKITEECKDCGSRIYCDQWKGYEQGLNDAVRKGGVRHGYWIEHPERTCGEDECSVCHALNKICKVNEHCTEGDKDYCPHCGAKMDIGKCGYGRKKQKEICGATGLECCRCNPGGCEHRRKN